MISNCDDVRGMIPWFLTGALEDDERQQVLRHLATCEACRHDLADTRLAAEIFDQHPPTEAILALAWDETPHGIDPALLQEHLASCPRCAAELELARMSRRLEEDDKILPLARRATPASPSAGGWRGWRAAAVAAGLAGVLAFAGWFQTAGRVRTLEEQVATRPPAPAPAPPVAGDSGAEARAQQLAAELEKRLHEMEEEAATLRAQEQELRGQLDQLADARPTAATPQIITWIEDLRPSSDVVRGSGPEALDVPPRANAVLLLAASHRETHREHAVEIVDAAGKVVWSAAGLQRNAAGDVYPLTLPPGSLPAGVYTIRVFGTADGRREPVETYSIRVQ